MQFNSILVHVLFPTNYTQTWYLAVPFGVANTLCIIWEYQPCIVMVSLEYGSGGF
jgi:hypothetical protein